MFTTTLFYTIQSVIATMASCILLFDLSIFVPISPCPDLVAELYPRRPQMVEQRVLPLLWHLLGSPGGSGSVQGRGGLRGASASLCLALHTHMGPSLVDRTAAQPANIHPHLN